jgi:thiamine-phosphate pyrophosphorylase
MRLPDPPLLLITDRSQSRQPLADAVTSAFVAGCRWVSVREKDLSVSDQIALAKQLLPIAHHYGACLTLHGDPEIANACHADGVHLPADGNAARARAVMDPKKLIGCSVHSLSEVCALDSASVDYAIVGPTYASASKPGYGPVLGAVGLRAFASATSVPIIAIGGIEPNAVPDVIANGAAGIAVMGGVMRATNREAHVTALLHALADAKAQPRGR